MEWLKDAVVAAAVISLLGQIFVAWYQRKKSTSDLVLDISTTAKNIAEGGDTAVEAMQNVLGWYKTQLDSQKESICDQQGEINELKETSAILTQRKEERELQIKAMEYDIAQLRRQVNEWEVKYTELETKYTNSKKAIEILVKAMQDANIPLPPGLELLLGDSIAKFKLPKPGAK